MALCPNASSRKPKSRSFGLPIIRSRIMMVIFTTNSHSLSSCSRDFFLSASLVSSPSFDLQFFSVHSIAFLNSSGSKISNCTRRLISLMSTYSLRMPRYSWKKSALTIEPAIPIETDPMDRYDLPFMEATAIAALAKRNSFS